MRLLQLWLIGAMTIGCDAVVIQVLSSREDAGLDVSSDAGVPPCPADFEDNAPLEAGASRSGARAAWPGAHLLVLWREADALWTQRWSPRGEAIGPATSLPGTAASTVPTLLRRGEGFLVVFADANRVSALPIDANGSTSGDAIVVSDSASIDITTAEVAAGVHGDGGVSVVWSDLRHGDAELYFGGIDASQTALDERRLTNAAGRSYQCRLAVTASGVAVVWSDARSGDEELRFVGVDRAGVVNVAETGVLSQPGFDGDPRIVAISTGFLLVYVHRTNLFTAMLDESGGLRGTRQSLSLEDDTGSFDPSVLAYRDGFIVVWQDRRDGNLELYYRGIDATGSVVGLEQRITNATGSSYDADLVDVDGDIQVVWIDDRSGTAVPLHGRLPCL